MHDIPVQGDEAELPSVSFDIEGINDDLSDGLDNLFMSPQVAFGRMRQIMLNNMVEIPIVLDMDENGDEYIFGLVEDKLLYFIFAPTENGFYESYAQVVTTEELNDILSDDGEGDLS